MAEFLSRDELRALLWANRGRLVDGNDPAVQRDPEWRHQLWEDGMERLAEFQHTWEGRLSYLQIIDIGEAERAWMQDDLATFSQCLAKLLQWECRQR